MEVDAKAFRQALALALEDCGWPTRDISPASVYMLLYLEPMQNSTVIRPQSCVVGSVVAFGLCRGDWN